MTPPNLKLFRRHETTCTRAYPKDFRIYEEDTIKRKRRAAVADCSCTIYAEGTLYNKGAKVYLRPKSAGTRTWEEARGVRENWIAWGGTTGPDNNYSSAEELVTVPNSVDSFLTTKKNQ